MKSGKMELAELQELREGQFPFGRSGKQRWATEQSNRIFDAIQSYTHCPHCDERLREFQVGSKSFQKFDKFPFSNF